MYLSSFWLYPLASESRTSNAGSHAVRLLSGPWYDCHLTRARPMLRETLSTGVVARNSRLFLTLRRPPLFTASFIFTLTPF